MMRVYRGVLFGKERIVKACSEFGEIEIPNRYVEHRGLVFKLAYRNGCYFRRGGKETFDRVVSAEANLITE
jgi:hypothetical protein